MGYPYHFVTLDDQQAIRRRQLLDAYGQLAQLSVLLIPLALQLSLGLRLLLERLFNQTQKTSSKVHKSPDVSEHKASEVSSFDLGSYLSFCRWSLGNEPISGWGTWNDWIFGLSWTLWLLVLVVKDTGDDYLHVTRRFGIVAASQLPIHYLLAATSWNPLQFLARMGHEELNAYHRILGRIIVLFMCCHAILYLNFYVQLGLLSKRIRDRDVILGLCAASSILVLFTSSLAKVRDYNYRLFLVLHVIIAVSLLPVLWFHVSHLRVYILESGLIFIATVCQRKISQQERTAKISNIEGTGLQSILIDLANPLAKKYLTPGSHVYVKFPHLHDETRINPFTIAHGPNKDNQIQLVIRPRFGTTARIAQKPQHPLNCSIIVEGPYGAAKYFPKLTDYDNVLLVAGGVGATFTLPIYQHLLSSRRALGSPTRNIRCIWAVKDEPESHWGMRMLTEDNQLKPEVFQIFVTGYRGKEAPGDLLSQRKHDSIELDERQGLLGEVEASEDSTNPLSHEEQIIRPGRPSFRTIVDQFFSLAGDDKVAVLVCGPKGMGGSLRKEVGRWVTSRRHIFWHSEEFGL